MRKYSEIGWRGLVNIVWGRKEVEEWGKFSREKNKQKTKQQKKNLAICVLAKSIGNEEGLG
jgi:hypothetical protein